MRRAIALAALLLLPAAPAPARPAQSAAGTTLALSARADKTLPRDRLHAELRVEAAGADPVRVQNEINRRMAAALARAKSAAGVSVETGGYAVYPERDSKGTITGWRGGQVLRLASGDFPALLGLVGTLQGEGLALSDLSAELSPAAAKAAQDELTDAALKDIRARAARIASALGTRVERYTELHVGNAAVPPVPIRAMAAAAPGVPAPVAAAGEATVSVTVDATVLLAPVR